MGTMKRWMPTGPWSPPEIEPLEEALEEGQADALTGQNWERAWHRPGPGQLVLTPDRRPGPAGESIHPYANTDPELLSGRAEARWRSRHQRWTTTRPVTVAHCGEI